MNIKMEFPNTFEEFVNEYSFRDGAHVYTNGSELIQVFRVMQGYEHFSKQKEMKYVNSICNTCKSESTCTEHSNHVAECHGYKSECNTCKSEGTCLDEPMEDCKEFRETDEARRSRIEAKVKAHDERIRADERAKTINEIEMKLCAEIHFGYELEARVCEVLAEYEKEGNK